MTKVRSIWYLTNDSVLYATELFYTAGVGARASGTSTISVGIDNGVGARTSNAVGSGSGARVANATGASVTGVSVLALWDLMSIFWNCAPVQPFMQSKIILLLWQVLKFAQPYQQKHEHKRYKNPHFAMHDIPKESTLTSWSKFEWCKILKSC